MEGKKRTGIVFVMILVTFIICFCFTGCGNPEDAAVKFLDALKAGDQETAQSFAEEDVIDDNLDLTKEVKGIMDGIDIFYDTLGLEIPDEIKASYDAMVSDLCASFIESYELSEFTDNDDGSKSAKVTVNFSFPKTEVGYTGFADILTEETGAYYEINHVEIDELEETDAIYKLLTGSNDQAVSRFTEKVKGSEGDTANYLITISQDEDKKWKVTDMSLQDNTERERAFAEELLGAILDRDLDKVKEMTDDNLYNAISKMDSFRDHAEVEDQYYKTSNVTKDQITEEGRAAITKYIDYLLNSSLTSWSIDELTEEKGVAKVKAVLVSDYDVKTAASMDFNNKIQKLYEKYIEKHKKELYKIYEESGEEEYRLAVIKGALPDIMDMYIEEVGKTGPVSQTNYFYVVFRDARWIATSKPD